MSPQKARPGSNRPQRRSAEAGQVVPHYKSSLHLEGQKFASKERDRKAFQDGLFEMEPDSQAIQIMTSGLELSRPEMRAIQALQRILAKTGYKGNLEPDDGRLYEMFNFAGQLPRLSFSYSEYFEEYGVARGRNYDYHGREREDALQALQDLASKPRAIFYKREGPAGQGKGRKTWTKQIIRYRAPLIAMEEITGYQDLSPEQERELLAGGEVPSRAGRFVVTLTALFVDQIDRFFAQIPYSLLEDIRQATGRAKYSQAIDLFHYWLLGRNEPEWTGPAMALAQALWLDPLIKERQWRRVEKHLQECLDIAQELEYLLGFEWSHSPSTKLGMLHLRLNPEKCRRIGSKKGLPEATE